MIQFLSEENINYERFSKLFFVVFSIYEDANISMLGLSRRLEASAPAMRGEFFLRNNFFDVTFLKKTYLGIENVQSGKDADAMMIILSP